MIVMKKLMSRRQVQRKFSPGTLVLADSYSNNPSPNVMIIGWAPVIRSKIWSVIDDHHETVTSWDVAWLLDGRVTTCHWETLRMWMTLEDWENEQ